MPCPFGFTADDGEAEDELSEAEEQEGEETEAGEKDDGQGEVKGDADDNGEAKGKKKKKGKGKEMNDKERFDFEKDPISWFYQNQIKSEEEFEKKKDMLREAAKERLDQIMGKKGKRLEWPSDSEFDELSIHSSELSDLDSDCDSLASLASCANSWIVEAKYKTPAEGSLKTVGWIYMVGLAHSLFTSFVATMHTRKVQGISVNTWWASAAFFLIATTMALNGLLLLSSHYRNRKMLLGGQIGMLAVHSASIILITLNWFTPIVVDPKLKEGACNRYSANDKGSKLCKMLPGIEREMSEDTGNLIFGLALTAVGSILLVGLGVWYVMELGYVEKKAIKHKRRHKRRKHSIPWDKIKIIGPVTQCGGGGAPSKAGGGKCPVGFGSGAAACPVTGGGGGGDKKND